MIVRLNGALMTALFVSWLMISNAPRSSASAADPARLLEQHFSVAQPAAVTPIDFHRQQAKDVAQLASPIKRLQLEFVADHELPPVIWNGVNESCHTQGLEITDRHWIVSGRWESQPPRPILVRFDRENLQQYSVIDLTERVGTPAAANNDLPLDHPGGMCRVGNSLWIPVATSQRAGPTVIVSYSLADNMGSEPAIREVARVADHIGALSYLSSTGKLYGANWDTMQIHEWDVDDQGRLSHPAVIERHELLKGVPDWQLAVQDWESASAELMTLLSASQDEPRTAKWILAGGIDKRPSVTDKARGVIELLDVADRRSLARWIVPGPPDLPHPPTREGMATSGDHLYLLPGDLNRTARLLQYRWVSDAAK